MRRTPFFVASLIPLLVSFAVASPLAEAPSAFVRVHADSPVQFLPWGEPAFERAKTEQKPVYVVVGSLTQELARAMREQSFARDENAALLNEHFVCVVVDRDERPEVAAFFQSYLGFVKQTQGWPLNLWLTPEGRPFDGATYLPPSDEWGKEGFPNATRRVLAAWQADPAAQRAKAEEESAQLAAAQPVAPPAVDSNAVKTVIAEAQAAWLGMLDATHGGFGDPPRRLEPELLRFLLGQEGAAREAALVTLRAVAASPVRDPIDGGLFRSAGDSAWQQPYFQKLGADQVRGALAYRDAAKVADGPAMLAVADGMIRYALSLGSTREGFVAAEDGTPEPVMPSFLWTAAEMRAVVGESGAADILALLGVTDAGNLPSDAYLGIESTGRNLPRLAWDAIDGPATDQLDGALAALRDARAARPAPVRDGFATSGAHGMLLGVLARSTDEAQRAAARELAVLVREKLVLPEGDLRSGPGFTTTSPARDYALVIDGLLTFAAAMNDEPARATALALLDRVDALFWDAETGRYMAASLPLPEGVPVRVVAPAPDAGEPPSAESALLFALVTHDLGDATRRAALAAALVADIHEAVTPARGDQLLALQAFLRTLP